MSPCVRLSFCFILGVFLITGCSDDSQRTPEERGQRIYRAYCLSCHQADGAGIRGMYPPLQETEWVEGDEGRLIRLVLNGLAGPIVVKGEEYNNIMPAHGSLSDDQIADVLTYVRQNFGNEASAITADQVHAVRSVNERRGMWTAEELERATGIPGTRSE